VGYSTTPETGISTIQGIGDSSLYTSLFSYPWDVPASQQLGMPSYSPIWCVLVTCLNLKLCYSSTGRWQQEWTSHVTTTQKISLLFLIIFGSIQVCRAYLWFIVSYVYIILKIDSRKVLFWTVHKDRDVGSARTSFKKWYFGMMLRSLHTHK